MLTRGEKISKSLKEGHKSGKIKPQKFDDERKRKISDGVKKAIKNGAKFGTKPLSQSTKEKLSKSNVKRAKKRHEERLEMSLNEINLLSLCAKKKYFRIYHKNKCEICGWCKFHKISNSPLTQIHHKDGNNKNNDVSNFQLLCPNCHAETDSFMFHGKKH